LSDLNREFTALAGRSPDGEVVAVVAMDGGQFNRFFGGATVKQVTYTPVEGTLSYIGDYVGLLNFGADTGTTEVTGTAFLNANFTDKKVEGELRSRTAIIGGSNTALQSIVFVNGDINDDGTFAGTAEFGVDEGVGSYSGAFAGTDAAFVGGAVTIGNDVLLGAIPADATVFDAATMGLTNVQEFGIFVIDACGPVGTDCN
jgi:hypothetical protein